MAENQDPLGNGRDLLLAVVVGIFGLAIIILGMARITGNIGTPFQAYEPTDYEIATVQSEQAKENQEKLSRDTDGDGLNDFVEEFQFGTSAYLTDTDSDGRSDKDEIDAGEDPLCARGKTCNTFKQTGEDDGSAAIAAAGSEPTANEIRDLLEESSDISRKDLDAIPDEELTELYRETVSEVDNPFESGSTGSGVDPADLYQDLDTPGGIPLPGTDIVVTSLDDIRALPPEEVRNFLYSLGATEKDLEGLSDEALYSVLIQLIEAQFGQASPNSGNTDSASETGDDSEEEPEAGDEE